MYYGESVQERGGSSNSWNNGSNMLLRHQHAVLIGFTLLIYSLQGYTNVQAVDQVITEKEGQTVVVPCPVNKDKCGELHSLNWFKGDNRIAAMLLDDSNVTSVAEGFEDRVSVEQNPFRLIIRNLEIADQDIYLCDTTYFIPIETCDNFNGHRVELKVLVPPSEMVIWDEKGDRIANGTVIGPMQERQMLNLTCVVRNTTPMPEVGWYRGSELLPEVDIHYDDKDGLFNVTVELYLKLTRKDLAHNIECRAKSAAIQNTLSTQFSIDLQVRPTNIHINGVEKYTVQGSKVVLTCSVYGARPPVNLTWYNSTQTIDPAENDLTEIRTKAIEQADGTFYTQSELLFNATRFENDKEFRCEAENIVVKMNGEKPFQALLGLEVFYPPVIDVNPLNATVNTGDSVLLYCDYVANPATLKSVLWYRNGVSLNVSDSDHYKGGNSEHVALSIRHAVKEDIGNYTCELTNEAGQGISEEQINLDVLYVPTVEVLMTPVDSVKESEEANVTLICKIIDANPPILTKVRWYANSTLLKELPDCEETKEDLCHIDPSKLLLESIGRGFFYNYSCEGYNDAGWGPRSEDKELLVLYEPGPATIAHFPLIAVKKKSVTFSCSVDDPGYPETNSFRWLRGGRASSSDTKDYTIEPVGLDSRTNYSCYAMNAGGKGAIATVNLEVHAPPFFIKNLPPYTGMLHTSRNANLTCRIECVPRCEISWLKDGVPIEKNDTRYFVKDKYMDASPATGDFESMLSVLHFNMSNWPNNKFDIEGDNANYTCISTGNAVGPGIKSATYFSIEYAPDNTTVSEEVVYVAEETTPGRVMCKSRANPEPTYEWHFNDKPLIQGSALIINTGMTRNESGRYTCVAFNKHGRSTAETVIDVQYKPRCEIERKEIDDQDTLICTAYGNPEEADFSWSIKAENESVEALGSGDSKTFKDKSYYVLKEDYEIARTYRCVANNTVGVGAFCEIEVAEQLAWWQRWDKPALIILVASILVLLLAVIIICCIIICICRRRRRQDKSVQEKSSSMADPLTEPGEYENLPFHGLQTAPNKFTTPTTPTNFNNNTNVVRSVPRPKRLNGNISQTAGAAATYYGEHENDSQPQQQQQHYQQQQYSTIPSNRILANGTTRNEGGVIVHNNNSLAANTLQHNQNISDAASPNPHQMTYNLNNCFPKSYTEYYQNQQQQQHHQFQQKYGNSLSLSSNTHSSQLHGIEHDFNTYAVVERPHNTPTSSASSSMAGRTTNPFLAVSNFKKFDASGDEEVSGANGGVGNYQTTSMKRQGKRKTFIDKLEDRRFYSLKFAGNKHKQPNSKNAPVHFNASLIETSGSRVTPESGLMSAAAARAMGSLLGAGGGNDNKCKRHHSFAGGSLGDIESKGPVMRNGLHFYDPPAYENVNDAVQVHAAAVLSDMELPDPKSSAGTATVLLHPLPSYGSHNGVGGSGGSQGPKKKHHQRQHQPKEDLNLIEPERLSIYRSDSGISNSSYECVTPIPNGGGTQRGSSPSGKTPRTPKTPKTPKGHKNQTLAHSAVTASFNTSQKKPAPRVPSAPLYMNLNDQAPNGAGVGNLERPSSPNSTIATSAYESASSSQNDTTCNDPTSMSSTNSLYSNNKSMVSGALRCNRHQQPPELTTPEEYEQYQLGHHSHTHSASSLSVASSISASGNPNGIGRNTKCKKQQRSLGGANVNLMELNKRPLAHNSFLATNSAATTTTTCSKKFRRQTISDPYAHIKDINECEQWRQLQQYLAANHGDMQANNYCPKSPNAFKASAAVVVASTATEPSACVIAKSQQHEWRQSQQQQSQQNGTQSKNALANIQRSQSLSVNSSLPHHQQQMLMYYNETNDNFANKVGIMADPSMPASKNDNDHDNIRPSRKKRATVPIQQLGDHGLGRANLEKDSQSLSITHKNLSGRNAADSVDGHFDDVALTKEEKGLFHHQKQLQKHPSQKAKLPLTFTTAAAAALAPNQSLSDDLLANCIGRPVKLPLRKYHSFHFQPTQTVAGQQHLGNLQQLRAKQQQMQTILNFPQHMLSDDDNLNSTYNHKGPLVFRPYQVNEEVTFKPIQPSEESEDSMELQQDGSTPEIPKRQGEVYMDSGDFTNFTKLSTPKRHSSEENEEPPQLPKTAPPANFSDIKKLYGDMEINFETRTVTGASLTKAVHTPEERGSRTQELKTALNSGCGNTKTNISSLLQKSPKSGFSKPGIDYLGVSYITAANEKSPKTTRTQMKTATLNLDLNKNSPSIESPQHFKMLQKTLTANNNTPDSWGQAKLKQLGEIYKLSSSESSEEDKDSPAAKQKSQRKLNFSNDRQKQKPTLNPAASLEALEMLTKSQPELWRSNHAGSRQNLHQLELFHSLQKTKLQEKSQKAREDDDDEDLGYSFCEDDIDDNDDVKELGYAGSPKKIPQHSPRVTDIMAAGKDQENQVKFKLTQTHQEVQIFANKVGIMADPSMPASKNDNDHDNIRPSRKKRATVPIQQLGDHGLGRANLEKDSQSLSITHKNLSGRNAADSVDGHFDDVALTKEEKGLFHHQKQLQKHPSQKAKLPLTFTTAAAAALAPNQSLSDDLLANCIGRPVKLPLRKYHSFHFQPTQTVAGQQHLGNLQQLRAKQQQMQTILNFPQHMLSDDDNLNSTYNHKGPLVFRPYQVNEEVTFKPIQPSEESEDSMELQQDGSTPEIPKRQGEVYMDSGDFTNFTKLSTPKRHSSEENEEPPQLPKTAPPANFSDIKKLYGDMEINFETRTVTGASLTKAVHTPEERGSRTQELKTALNSGCGNTKTNISSLLQKSPKSGFSKPGIDYLGVSYITAANEKSPKTTRTQMKTATLNLDLNKNSPSIESPQHFKMLQKTLTANNNTPDSWGQAKLKQLGEIYKLSSSESSEEDKDSPAAKQKSQRKLNFSNDRQKQKPTLNPAASLEALEMLTKSQPELWRSNHAGSRQNLHQLELFHSLQKTKLQEKSQKAREDDDDEDLGYSFCEDDIDDNDDVKELGYAGSPKKIPQHSPRVTDIMAAGKDQENQVKFKLTQTHQEVQI
uniref:Ig-like domain-containing protein n=1 Tax=Stomoxys calcitrans TaxID=35570 RepID=A0A1I8PB99_STOCA